MNMFGNHTEQFLTIGADPELFLQDDQLNFKSAIGLFGGTKEKPKGIGRQCAIQEDNVALEFNIPPASSKTAFIESINYTMDILKTRAKNLHLNLAIVPSAEFSETELVHPKAKEFGCDPDWNCWTMRQNPRPSSKTTLRSAGGHVHIGSREFSPWDLGKASDLFLGVPSLKWDTDLKRRGMYGKSGAIRPKVYGVEYRTLSNFWLGSDELKGWVFDQVLKALTFLRVGNRLSSEEGNEIQTCINTSNLGMMVELTQRYAI